MRISHEIEVCCIDCGKKLPMGETALIENNGSKIVVRAKAKCDCEKGSLEEFLLKKIDSICGSYRHDFGFLSETYKKMYRHSAKEWIIAICKELD